MSTPTSEQIAAAVRGRLRGKNWHGRCADDAIDLLAALTQAQADLAAEHNRHLHNVMALVTDLKEANEAAVALTANGIELRHDLDEANEAIRALGERLISHALTHRRRTQKACFCGLSWPCRWSDESAIIALPAVQRALGVGR